MEVQLLGHLPDEIATWTGTAAALADECNRLMPGCGLAAEAGSANERLVRHYVQIGVLTPPEREGREAIFGVQQIAEFLAARRLLSEGWPLAKIGELLKNVVLVEDTALAPETVAEAMESGTSAERALRRIRAKRRAVDEPDSAPSTLVSRRRPSARAAMPFASAPEPTGPEETDSPRMANSLGIATQIAERRGELRDSLLTLGNTSGTTERRRIVRISLTPWCHVDIEARRLSRLSESDPEVLGNALTNALREERLRKGDS